MKIRILLPVLMFCFHFVSAQYCGNSGPSQCTPTGGVTQVGFNPSFFQLAPLINGVASSTTLQFLNYDTTAFAGTTVTIDSLQIDTIQNLPIGMCWSTNKVNNRFANQETGCILFSGTPCSTPGQYQLYIVMDAWVHGIGDLTLNASQESLYCILRVINPGETPATIDTTGIASGNLSAIIPYGPSANCQSGPPVVTLGANTTVCNGSTIILDPLLTGGVAPFTYSWQTTGNVLNCNTCGSPMVTITQNSTYTVAVTDASGNVTVATVSYSVSANTNTMQLNVANTNVSCAQPTDTSTLTVSNEIYPFTINWGDGNSQYDSALYTPNHTYAASGGYVISVTDSLGCVSTIADTVLNNGIIIVANQAVQPNCFNSSNGSLSLTVTGGTQPYAYVWNNSAITAGLTGIAPGYYEVTVTDNTLCSATFVYLLNSISDPWGYYAYLTEADANCSNNGAITSNIFGGLAPFTYHWSNSASTANLASLGSGAYSLTVTDSAGCQTTGSANVNSSCVGLITGKAFADINNDCIYDAGDTILSGIYMVATSITGESFYGYTDINGNYSITVTGSGNFTLSAYTYSYSGCGNLVFCSNSGQVVNIPVLGDTVNNNYVGLQGSTGFDLGIHPGWTSADPGFTKQYWVFYYNSSYTPFVGPATITLVYDSNLTYLSTDDTPAPVNNAAAHTLTWVVDSVTGIYNWQRLDGNFQVPASLSLNYLLQTDYTITPMIGDCDTSDNHYHYSETVIGSHDPNEKDVEPAGPITESDSILTYTIHFQNTGTDSTHFVIIKDTLSSNLDPATVRNIASSDKYSIFNISGKGILTWTFNPLRIVDSITNPSGSKRFITFTVKKKANLPVGATISNTASVYFDYNTAVVTNTVADTVIVSGIFEVANNSGISVKAFPNPFNDFTNIVVTGLNEKFGFELYDVTGRLQQSMPSITNNQFHVQRGGLANGIYLYRIVVGDKQVAYGKLVVE